MGNRTRKISFTLNTLSNILFLVTGRDQGNKHTYREFLLIDCSYNDGKSMVKEVLRDFQFEKMGNQDLQDKLYPTDIIQYSIFQPREGIKETPLHIESTY
jgi:hypothetical protein